MPKEFIAPTNVFESRKSLAISQGIKAGNLIYLSGAMPVDEKLNLVGKGDFAAQSRQALEHVRRVLAEAGATMSDIVKVTWYVTHIGGGEDWDKAAPIRKEYFGDWCPCETVVEVKRLFFPDQLLELEAIAVLG